MSGSIRSRMMQSTSRRPAAARPSLPVTATTASCPSNSRMSLRPRAISRSSSTISIRATSPLERSLADRNPERERTPLARLALDADLAAVHLGDLLGDRQADAAAAGLLHRRTAAAVELLEDLGLLGHRDAQAAVRDREIDESVALFDPHPDLLPLARVLQRVVEQVEKRQPERRRIRQRLRERVAEVGHQREALTLDPVPVGFQFPGHQARHVRNLEVLPAGPALQAREVQEVADQAAHPIALVVDDAEILRARALVLDAPGNQDLAEHPDQRKRRLQLVADVGDEILLELDELALAPGADVDDRQAQEGQEHAQDDQEEEEAALVPLVTLELGVVARHALQDPLVERAGKAHLVEVLDRTRHRRAVDAVVLEVDDAHVVRFLELLQVLVHERDAAFKAHLEADQDRFPVAVLLDHVGREEVI